MNQTRQGYPVYERKSVVCKMYEKVEQYIDHSQPRAPVYISSDDGERCEDDGMNCTAEVRE